MSQSPPPPCHHHDNNNNRWPVRPAENGQDNLTTNRVVRVAGPAVAGRPGTTEAAVVGGRVVTAADAGLHGVVVARLAAAAPRLP